MVEWITAFIAQYGYAAIALLMVAENVFPPLPSELIMPFAGFVAARGDLHPAGVVAAGAFGSVLGAAPWFYAGRAFGIERLSRLADSHGRWITVSPADLEKAQRWFRRHGALALVAGRLLPGLRTLISIPAGVSGLRLGTFVFWSVIGSALWCSLLTAAGYAMENQYERIAGWLDPVAKGLLALLLVIYVVRVVRGARASQH